MRESYYLRGNIMKAISILVGCAAVVVISTAAQADDFFDACMGGASPATDMGKICTCISGKVPGSMRPDVVEALRRSNQAMSDTSRPIDPSTLPPNLMRGLQAFVSAQADCM
jgi:hypothetical protein